MIILVSNLGRDKREFSVEVSLDADVPDLVYLAVVRSGALRSRDIDVSWNSSTRSGHVFAGMHCVGDVSASPSTPTEKKEA